MFSAKQKRKTQFIKLLFWGLLVIGLYAGLYVIESQLIQWTAQGKWTFIVPIGIAFLFSFVHGHFTGDFWDILGIKPNLSGEK
jgi:uncharacterized membrane protein HdeD (DUF308 family)